MSRRTDAYVGGVLGDRYEIVRKLGAGGMGEVFEARRLDLGDRVAVKILREEDREDPELRARFLREAQTLARVQSPHVVRIVDFMAPPGQVAFIAMEFLEGRSAGELLRLRGPFSMREVGPLAQQMFAGLAAVHAVGLVHRDIKPQNLVIVDGGPLGPLVKIVDFGLAKTTVAAEGERPLTHHAGMLGTPSYMAPEQIGGNATIDARADIYGAAATFIALATGKTVYDERGEGVLAQVISGQRLPVEAVAPELGAELCAVLERALAADRNMRHARIEELAAEVARGLGRATSSGPATYAALPSLSREDLEPASRTALTEAPVFSTSTPGAAEATRGRAGTGPMPAHPPAPAAPSVPGLMGTLDGSRAYPPPSGYGPPGGAPPLTAAGPYAPPMAQGPHVPNPSRPSFPSQSGFAGGHGGGAPLGPQAPHPFTATLGPASHPGGPLSSPQGPPSQSGYGGYGPPSAPRPSVPSGVFPHAGAPAGPAAGGPTYPPGSFPGSPGSGAPGPFAGPYGVPLPTNAPAPPSSGGKVGLVVGIVLGVLVLGGVAGAAFMLRRTERDAAGPKAAGAGIAEASKPSSSASVEPAVTEANAAAPVHAGTAPSPVVPRDGGVKPSPSAAPSGSGMSPVPVPSGGKALSPDPTRTNMKCTTDAQCGFGKFCEVETGYCICSRIGSSGAKAGLWCGNACVSQTRKSCGACGVSCAESEVCDLVGAGWIAKCVDCTGRGSGYAVCGESCVQPARSLNHCGRCGHSCSSDPLCRGKTCTCEKGTCVPR